MTAMRRCEGMQLFVQFLGKKEETAYAGGSPTPAGDKEVFYPRGAPSVAR
jgi:hypothetical protein